jgi:3'-phosphoadenosine 5'-phosphosulfate (PAPS) 3'-phosphatase
MSAFTQAETLQDLCTLTLEVCHELALLIRPFYDSLGSETSKLKSDKSVFTIADGIVQHLLINSFFITKIGSIIGEEDDCIVNLVTRPYTVDDLIVPEEYFNLIDEIKIKIESLSQRLSIEKYQELCVFIDPIDGTREFSTMLGEQCSICVGFSNGTTGLPVAGVVFRPLTTPYTFAAGAVSEHYHESLLDYPATPTPHGLLTSNGSISPFIQQLILELGYTRVPSGGAGNKMLMLLEGKGGCYIQDRGVSRWDTCAAQAVIESARGTCSKLTAFVANQTLVSYTYLKSTINLDFDPTALANQTPYNSNLSKERAGAIKQGEKFPITEEEIHTTTKPYSNLCGVFALDQTNLGKLEEFAAAIERAKAVAEPSYD